MKLSLDQIVFEIGGQQPHGTGNTRIGRHNDLRDTDLSRDFRPVQGAGPAEGNQTEIARIDALLHRARANGIGHVGVENGEHPFSRFVHLQPQRLSQLADHLVGQCGIQLHSAT